MSRIKLAGRPAFDGRLKNAEGRSIPYAPAMPDDSKRKAAAKAVKAAQGRFEHDSQAAREARRKAFAKAQKDGLSLREIGELVGLDHSRVGQIIRGD